MSDLSDEIEEAEAAIERGDFGDPISGDELAKQIRGRGDASNETDARAAMRLKCSFCGREKPVGRLVVAGPGVYICVDCIELAYEISNEWATEDALAVTARRNAERAAAVGTGECAMSAASNTTECIESLIGHSVIGVLIGALPVGRADLARGTRTLVLDDGTGFTFTSNGSFWRETAEDIRRAVAVVERDLAATKRTLEGVRALAGPVVAAGAVSERP